MATDQLTAPAYRRNQKVRPGARLFTIAAHLQEHEIARLGAEALARRTSISGLMTKVIVTMTEDNLFNAILEE